MTILEERRDLFGYRVKVICTDGQVIKGLWAEWWDEEDNEWLAEEGFEVCESIMVETDKYPIEITIREIQDIQEA
ncbi:MAG: hypothetical protein Q4C56_07075 [Peptococcaceae bacterium]|nr:hypothetical protein [Peptococcaceae bacterium]